MQNVFSTLFYRRVSRIFYAVVIVFFFSCIFFFSLSFRLDKVGVFSDLWTAQSRRPGRLLVLQSSSSETTSQFHREPSPCEVNCSLVALPCSSQRYSASPHYGNVFDASFVRCKCGREEGRERGRVSMVQAHRSREGRGRLSEPIKEKGFFHAPVNNSKTYQIRLDLTSLIQGK